MKLFTRIVLLASIIALLSLSAFAGTDHISPNTLGVSANVVAACSVASGGAVAFGAYDPTSGSDKTATGTLSMTCTNGTNPFVKLGEGLNKDGASTAAAPLRNMLNGTTKMSYQLYSDSGDTLVWDNATGVQETSTGAPQTISVYGKITAGQPVIAGSYADTVTITLNY